MFPSQETLNGDGFEDLVAAHSVVQNDPALPTSTNAYVFFNNGSGTFRDLYNTGVQRYAHMRLDARLLQRVRIIMKRACRVCQVSVTSTVMVR